MSEPTALEWAVTAVAVLAVVAVGTAVVVRPALPRAATTACRVAAAATAALAVSALLTGAVLASAGSVAGGIDLAADEPVRPDGAFAGFLFDRDPNATVAAGTYAPLVLGPLAALLGVLAHALADPARTPGLRAVGGAVLAAVLVGSGLVVLGDTGALATWAGAGALVLAAVAVGALLVDEFGLRRSVRAAVGSEVETEGVSLPR